MAPRIYAPAALRERAQQELALRKFEHFARYMWPVVEPKRPLVWSWSLTAICDHLEAVHRGEIRNLLVNIPPRSLKSSFISVLFPCWEWTREPSFRYLTASYAKALAIRDAVRSRRVMSSTQYQALIEGRGNEGEPLWIFTGDQNEKSRYENSRTGFRICTSPDSGTLGEGGDRTIVDDPHDMRSVESETQRRAVIEWYDEAMSTRGNDPKTIARIVVMQRLNQQDLSEHLIEQGGYEHLCITQEYEPDHPARRTTSIGFTDPRTTAGELLCPERMGPAEVAEAKVRLGSAAYAAQHQQRPAPAGGLIFQRAWFRKWTSLPPKLDEVMCSVDLAFRGKDNRRTFTAEIENLVDPDFCVMQIWGRLGSSTYLLDERRGQWDFLRSLHEMVALCTEYPQARKKLIEAKANGDALISMLRDKVPGIVPFEPGEHGSKIQRATACVPFVEAGNVHLPDERIAPWITDWLDELCNFPLGKNDDRVDAFSQVHLTWHVNDAAASLRKLKAMGNW